MLNEACAETSADFMQLRISVSGISYSKGKLIHPMVNSGQGFEKRMIYTLTKLLMASCAFFEVHN